MKTHSTGALSTDAKKKQDDRYKEGHRYDYLIIGTGMAALTCGSLLANAGKRICMLEAHDVPGGMAHTFKINDYQFCAQVHYIWGCAPGGRIYEFLKRIGMEKKITFDLLGPIGYDKMSMPDGKEVMIPYGWDNLALRVGEAYPGQEDNVKRFTKILAKIRAEIRLLPPRKITLWDILTKGYRYTNLLKYMHSTLQEVFDECELSKEAQAVLIANAGDMMAPPNELSIFAYCGLFGGYNTGAYYPHHHFKSITQGLADFITSHEGCHIYYETEVNGIEVSEDKGIGVGTLDGKRFVADNYICNMDPQKASKMIGWDKFPAKMQKSLSYKYSPSGILVYLGLKGIDLRKHGFGKFNTWHLTQWDMNQMWKEQAKGDFGKPWIFISTPSLHTDDRSTTPPGGEIMEIATYTEFDWLRELKDSDPKAYIKKKNELADIMIRLVEKRFVPNLHKHIAVKVVGTPTTHEDYCYAPLGNSYGSYLTPEQIGLGRLRAETPFANLWWCNASSGAAGIHGTTCTGMDLYMDLTGDRFYSDDKSPTDDEKIAKLPKQ